MLCMMILTSLKERLNFSGLHHTQLPHKKVKGSSPCPKSVLLQPIMKKKMQRGALQSKVIILVAISSLVIAVMTAIPLFFPFFLVCSYSHEDNCVSILTWHSGSAFMSLRIMFLFNSALNFLLFCFCMNGHSTVVIYNWGGTKSLQACVLRLMRNRGWRGHMSYSIILSPKMLTHFNFT